MSHIACHGMRVADAAPSVPLVEDVLNDPEKLPVTGELLEDKPGALGPCGLGICNLCPVWMILATGAGMRQPFYEFPESKPFTRSMGENLSCRAILNIPISAGKESRKL